MNINLAKHRALVSGSTAGIGLAIAQGIAAAGGAVVVNGRTQAAVDQAIAHIRAQVADAKVSGVAADLGSAQGVEALIAAAGEADILINNLGIYGQLPFEQINDAEWQRFFDVNVMSGVRLSRHYFPRMLKNNWGRIVFVSSESGLNIPGEMVHYGMTKTAQLAIARGLAELTAGSKVTVNSVLPGPTRSSGVDRIMKNAASAQGVAQADIEAALFKLRRPSSLLKRLATVEEVANMVVYVVSEQASATNGAALRVDGGVVRSIG